MSTTKRLLHVMIHDNEPNRLHIALIMRQSGLFTSVDLTDETHSAKSGDVPFIQGIYTATK